MKKLHAKKIPMHTMMTTMFAAVLFTIMALNNDKAVMASTGWDGFKTSMTDFFYKGLGLVGLQGVGIAIAIGGITMMVISIVVHKMNPQSRLPGWFTCLAITVLGTMLFTGVSPVLDIIYWIRDTVLGWFGFKDFGQWS